MPLTLGSVTFDAHNVRGLAEWWAQQIDGSVIYTHGDEFAVLTPKDSTLGFCFQKAKGERAERNRVHVDLVSKDVESDVERLVDAGAEELGSHVMEGNIHWTVLADPEGNHFCISSKPAGAWDFGG